MGLKKYVDEDIVQGDVQIEGEGSENLANSDLVETLENVEIELKSKITKEELLTKIGDSRKEYALANKKQKRINLFFTIGTLVLLIGCLALILCQKYIPGTMDGEDIINPWPTWVGFSIIVVAFITTFIVNKIFRKKLSLKAEEYIKILYNTINEYLYGDEKFSNKVFEPRRQMEPNVFLDARFYKNIKNVKSRNYVEVTYKDKKLSSSDLAGSILVKNRTQPLFLGKLFEYENNYDLEGGDKYILFQLKGKELSRPIDNVDDLKLVQGNDKYVIYSNDQNYKKVLNDKVIGLLKGFKVDNLLIDVIVSIRKGKTIIGIDYDDKFLSIPVDNEYDVELLDRQVKDLERILSILDLIK